MVYGVSSLFNLMIRLGGVARWSTLRRHLSRSQIDRAVINGTLLRVARGRFALPGVPESLMAAIQVTGVVSHRSAAAQYGWEQKQEPLRPEVTVPRDRRIPIAARRRMHIHYADLGPDDTDGNITSRRRTLFDSLRQLPWPTVKRPIRSNRYCGRCVSTWGSRSRPNRACTTVTSFWDDQT